MSRFWAIINVRERNSDGVPTSFWRTTFCYPTKEQAEAALADMLPGEEPYEVCELQDGFLGCLPPVLYEGLSLETPEERYK